MISGFTEPGWLRTIADQRDRDAALEHFRRRIDVRLDDDDDRRRRAGGRIVGELADAAGHQDPDVGLAVRPSPRPAARIVSRKRASISVVGQRHGERHHAGRLAQPPHVPIEEKRLPVVGAQRLVDALAVQEAVIEDRDRRRAPDRTRAR